MSKKIRMIYLAVIMLGLSVLSFAEVQKVKLITGEWDPFTTEKTKEKGFFTEIVTAIFKEAGMEPEYIFLPWKRGEQEIANGTAFATFPYIATDERKKSFDFSDEVANSTGRFFYLKTVFKDKIDWSTYADIKKYKIGGTLGYWYEKPFKEAGLTVDYAPTDEQGVKKLYEKRFDLLASDELVGWELIKKIYPKDLDKFETITKPLSVDPLRLMISKTYPNSKEITEKFNVALKSIKDKGIYGKILKKYNVK